MPNRLDVMTIVQHLSHYLRVHAEACDTSEGIARWWVELDDPAPVVTVEAALDCLVACGVMEAQLAVDGRVRYRRRAEVADERLDALMQDPQSALPPHDDPAPPHPTPRKWH